MSKDMIMLYYINPNAISNAKSTDFIKYGSDVSEYNN